MNTEEKAKAYDEVVARINKAVSDGLVSENFGRDMLGIVESEDERIRKAIKCYVEDMPDTYGFAHGIGKKEMLSYLEKQKELPFVKDVMLGYPGLYFYDGERMHFQGNPAMEEKQKEQKPASGNSEKPNNQWSEEDEDMRYKATAVLNKLCASNEEFIWAHSTLVKVFHWLKSLRPQPKQE